MVIYLDYQVGDWLLAGRQFLHTAAPIQAVKMKTHVAGDQVEISLRASLVSFPLLTPEDLGLNSDMAEAFIKADSAAVLTEQHFGCKYVAVLPRLSRARLVSVSKLPPQDSKFSDWAAMKRYWKNMYGYRLQRDQEQDSGEPLVYYNVSFYGASLLTYPEWTVRDSEPRPLPRSDPKPIIEKFLADLAQLNRTVCGQLFSVAAAPVIRARPYISSSAGCGEVAVGWQPPERGVPLRSAETRGQARDHSRAWSQREERAATVTSAGDNGDTSVTSNKGQEDSGHARSAPTATTTDVKKTSISTGIKPSFVSKLIKDNNDSGYTSSSSSSLDTSSDKSMLSTRLKPTFVSKLFSSSSSSTSRLSCNSKSPEIRNPIQFNSILSRVAPSQSSNLHQLNPDLKAPEKKSVKPVFAQQENFKRGPALPAVKEKTQKQPKLSSSQSSANSSENNAPRKSAPSCVVDVDALVANKRVKELSKVNVASLLAYCRKVGIKEARSKSKKEELLKMIHQRHNLSLN